MRVPQATRKPCPRVRFRRRFPARAFLHSHESRCAAAQQTADNRISECFAQCRSTIDAMPNLVRPSILDCDSFSRTQRRFSGHAQDIACGAGRGRCWEFVRSRVAYSSRVGFGYGCRRRRASFLQRKSKRSRFGSTSEDPPASFDRRLALQLRQCLMRLDHLRRPLLSMHLQRMHDGPLKL